MINIYMDVRRKRRQNFYLNNDKLVIDLPVSNDAKDINHMKFAKKGNERMT